MAKREYCWCFALLVVLMLLLLSRSETSESGFVIGEETLANANMINGDMPCDEIYVVRKGETLQTISAKCKDPFILENNPHIYDPDDVYPGLVLLITPFRERSSLK